MLAAHSRGALVRQPIVGADPQLPPAYTPQFFHAVPPAQSRVGEALFLYDQVEAVIDEGQPGIGARQEALTRVVQRGVPKVGEGQPECTGVHA